MPQDPEVYCVRFANREAVQRFQAAKDLIDEAIEDSPWNDTLQTARAHLVAAWNGLSFGIQE